MSRELLVWTRALKEMLNFYFYLFVFHKIGFLGSYKVYPFNKYLMNIRGKGRNCLTSA